MTPLEHPTSPRIAGIAVRTSELALGMKEVLMQNNARDVSAAASWGGDASSRRDSASGGSCLPLSREARLSGATGEAGLDCRGFGLD